MKEYLKNPDFYFVLAPILAVVWALTAWLYLHPQSVRSWDETLEEYKTAETRIGEILKIEPERLDFKVEKGSFVEFNYTNVIDEFAQKYKIPQTKYKLSAKGMFKKAGKKARSADMTVDIIDIERMTQFLSAILQRWPDLKCEMLSLEKLKSGKNDWKVRFRFTYYYD